MDGEPRRQRRYDEGAMSQLKTRPRKTVDDYFRLPEGIRAELIEGELLLGLNASGGYESAGYFEERDTVASPLLAGLALPVLKLFN